MRIPQSAVSRLSRSFQPRGQVSLPSSQSKDDDDLTVASQLPSQSSSEKAKESPRARSSRPAASRSIQLRTFSELGESLPRSRDGLDIGNPNRSSVAAARQVSSASVSSVAVGSSSVPNPGGSGVENDVIDLCGDTDGESDDDIEVIPRAFVQTSGEASSSETSPSSGNQNPSVGTSSATQTSSFAATQNSLSSANISAVSNTGSSSIAVSQNNTSATNHSAVSDTDRPSRNLPVGLSSSTRSSSIAAAQNNASRTSNPAISSTDCSSSSVSQTNSAVSSTSSASSALVVSQTVSRDGPAVSQTVLHNQTSVSQTANPQSELLNGSEAPQPLSSFSSSKAARDSKSKISLPSVSLSTVSETAIDNPVSEASNSSVVSSVKSSTAVSRARTVTHTATVNQTSRPDQDHTIEAPRGRTIVVPRRSLSRYTPSPKPAIAETGSDSDSAGSIFLDSDSSFSDSTESSSDSDSSVAESSDSSVSEHEDIQSDEMKVVPRTTNITYTSAGAVQKNTRRSLPLRSSFLKCSIVIANKRYSETPLEAKFEHPLKVPKFVNLKKKECTNVPHSKTNSSISTSELIFF